ncbi:hypothetical protein cyc_00037 [Cyclospora cayetanensis]|uniref:Uncharacterized protein n=1 Tax=Cyclospora cayetanensis TaxID=88456 RepID=A0A1D3CSJ2_9EIME|nr:hypothetical protein cyc_00037 [Cyclospora cayetanensis]
MKGRWRKDKRSCTIIQKEGGNARPEEQANKELSTIQTSPNASLAGFTFSGSLRSAGEQRVSCYASAHNSLVRSQFAMCDGTTHDDFMKALTGGSICIPEFFKPHESEALFSSLLKELSDYAKDQTLLHDAASKEADPTPAEMRDTSVTLPDAGLCRWSRHLKHENPEGFPTFQKVVQRLSNYFDLDIYATRMNIYPDGSHWKPHHHDSHAYSSERQQAEDFTVGASFGGQRSLEFAHVKTDFCGSQEVGEERQYLYYPDPHNPTNGICVESCPKGAFKVSRDFDSSAGKAPFSA